jgi:hypothetical protein
MKSADTQFTTEDMPSDDVTRRAQKLDVGYDEIQRPRTVSAAVQRLWRFVGQTAIVVDPT